MYIDNISDLEEVEERLLLKEINRRKLAREMGLCDYCNRIPTAKECRFPKRHHNKETVENYKKEFEKRNEF